jgi:hypothetical protein
LEAALKVVPATKTAALDNISYNRMTRLLADCYLRQDNSADALRVLKIGLGYLKKRKVIVSVLDAYGEQIKELRK